MRTVTVNGDALTIEDVVDVARGAATAELAPSVAAVMEPSRSVVAAAIAGDAPVYGVNTGFGALADTRVGARDLERLQGAIVRSHAAGTGESLDDAAVRAVLLLRARTLAAGYSGVRVDLPARLSEMLNLGLLPVVPGKGSVGASGDLAQLAHLAQTLIGEGRLRGQGDPLRGRPAAAPGAAREPGPPPRAARGFPAAGQPPAQQARRAGRVLPALRAAGAWRGPGRAAVRPRNPGNRAWRDGGQPRRGPRRRGHDHRELPRGAARVRRRHAGHGPRRAGQHQRAPGGPDALPGVLPRPAAVRGAGRGAQL